MDPALANLGWTEEQWNRICSIVTEEAQRARVVAQALPLVGVEDDSTVAIPEFRVAAQVDPFPVGRAAERLWVNSDPTLYLTTISVNVPLRAHEVADPQLRAALVMFRRAANYVVRIEDALAFYGRPAETPPPGGIGNIPPVYRVTGNGTPDGILSPGLVGRIVPPALPGQAPTGDDVFNQIIAAINALERGGASGPFACILSHRLFELVCTPNGSLVMPRDRLLPFLQGPLLRASQIDNSAGCVIALGGNPIELVVASDIGVCFLQTTAEPRQLFRVSERVALRIKDPRAIAMLG